MLALLSNTVDVVRNTVTDTFQSNPTIGKVGAVLVGAGLALKLYLKLTTGKCDLSRANVKGKTALITGSSAGIGYETALALAGAGARVVMACRSVSKAEKCRAKILKKHPNADIHILELDLSSLASVHRAAAEFLSWNFPLHLLINNAGIAVMDKIELTEDCLERIMATNHFGHFLLTNLLLDCIRSSAPARIVNVSSLAHFRAKLELDNLNCERESRKPFVMYGKSKLANVMFTRSLAIRLQGTGVTTNSLHPGAIATDIMNNMRLFLKIIIAIPWMFFKTSREGAQTQLYLACDPDVEHVSGQYFSDCKPATTNLQALDDEVCQQLWEVSEKLTSFKP